MGANRVVIDGFAMEKAGVHRGLFMDIRIHQEVRCLTSDF
jgi:hypothetical protein